MIRDTDLAVDQLQQAIIGITVQPRPFTHQGQYFGGIKCQVGWESKQEGYLT
jgi:hypothetical protein